MGADACGYRGYIASRPVLGRSFPQRVQNLVIRDYAAARGLAFKLSLTEYAMPGCYMMLESLLEESARLDGIIVFSLFMLPTRADDRRRIYDTILGAGACIHAALERSALQTEEDILRAEDTLAVANALVRAPLGGRFAKDAAAPVDPFVRAVRARISADHQRSGGAFSCS